MGSPPITRITPRDAPETRATGSLTWTRTYQGATGRIASQEVASGAQTIASFELGYDEAGNVTSKDAFVEGLPSSEQGEWTYAYDGAGRMTASTDPAGETTTYDWDGAGNRTSVKVGTSPEETTAYDQASLPVSVSSGTTYTHDAAGNLIGVDHSGDEDDLAIDYDAWGRTTLAVPGTSDPISYELDALNRVVLRVQGAEESAYLYVGEGESPAKIAITGGTDTLFAHAPSGPLAQQVGTSDPRLLISDHHTDVVGLADPSGTAEGARSFSPWGEVREDAMDSILGFQGDVTDPVSGLVDMGTRIYAPSLGRFTTRDVVFGDSTAPISLNQYVYGVGSPVTQTDPTGMCPPQYCYDTGYHGVKTKSGGHKSGHSPQYARHLVPTQQAVAVGYDPKQTIRRAAPPPPPRPRSGPSSSFRVAVRDPDFTTPRTKRIGTPVEVVGAPDTITAGPASLVIQGASATVTSYNTGYHVAFKLSGALVTPVEVPVESVLTVTAIAGGETMTLSPSPHPRPILHDPRFTPTRWEGWIPLRAGAPTLVRLRVSATVRNPEGTGYSPIEFTPLSRYELELP